MRPPSSGLGNSQVAVQVAVWRQSCRGHVEVVVSVGVVGGGCRCCGSRGRQVVVVVVVDVVVVVVVRW